MVLFIREDAARVAKGEPSYFKMKVFEPPCLSVDVPDRKFANAVEASMNQTHLRVSAGPPDARRGRKNPRSRV